MKTQRVLMIDDEAGFAGLVKLNLERTGRFQVRVERDPLIALVAAREFQPDVILLDIVMPGKDGGQLLSELQADEQLKKIPVIFLTATATAEVVKLQKGMVRGRPLIAKPVEPQKLIQRIDEVLDTPYFTFHLGWKKESAAQPPTAGVTPSSTS